MIECSRRSRLYDAGAKHYPSRNGPGTAREGRQTRRSRVELVMTAQRSLAPGNSLNQVQMFGLGAGLLLAKKQPQTAKTYRLGCWRAGVQAWISSTFLPA
jgi:hypothetical protein